MLRHDTFAKRGREAFPDAAYLAPEGFSRLVGFRPGRCCRRPPEWGGEMEVVRLEGVPSMEEHAVFHRSSRTLIVADLLFNFGPDAPAWTRLLMRLAVGRKHDPGMARSMRMTREGRRSAAPFAGGDGSVGFRPDHRRTRRDGRNGRQDRSSSTPCARRGIEKFSSTHMAVASAGWNCYE